MMMPFHAMEAYSLQLKEAARFIQERNDFLVVSHIQPDGDAAGSTFAMAWILAALNKRFTLLNEGPMPDKFMYMSAGEHTVLSHESGAVTDTYKQIISVDCADFARIGNASRAFAEGAEILNIDHHATNDGFGACNLVHADAAATVEILYDLALELGISFVHELNVCIYSGLLTDTGGFRYANTTPKVMEIAAELLKRGVKGHELAEQLLEKLTFPQVTLLQRTLTSLSFAHNRQVGWLAVTLEDLAASGATSEDLDGLVNYPRNVEGVEVGLLFKERDGVVKVSLRSAGKVDVSQVAKAFGGGGHVRAAGCAVVGSLDKAIERVVKEVGLALA